MTENLDPQQAGKIGTAITRIASVVALATGGAINLAHLLVRLPSTAQDKTLAAIEAGLDLVELIPTIDQRTRPIEVIRAMIDEWRDSKLAAIAADRQAAADRQRELARKALPRASKPPCNLGQVIDLSAKNEAADVRRRARLMLARVRQLEQAA